MDRNDNRWWYDRGYSLGVKETQRDAIIPKAISAWVLLLVAHWDVYIAGAFLFIVTWFWVESYKDRKHECETKRDMHNPGSKWE